MHNGTIGNFAQNTLKSYFLTNFLESHGIIKTHVQEEKMYCTYRAVHVIEDLLSGNKPISVIILQEEENVNIVVCTSKKRNNVGSFITKGFQIKVDENCMKTNNMGMEFFKMDLISDIEINCSNREILSYGILLPFRNRYMITTSDWKEFKQMTNIEDTFTYTLCTVNI